MGSNRAAEFVGEVVAAFWPCAAGFMPLVKKLFGGDASSFRSTSVIKRFYDRQYTRPKLTIAAFWTSELSSPSLEAMLGMCSARALVS